VNQLRVHSGEEGDCSINGLQGTLIYTNQKNHAVNILQKLTLSSKCLATRMTTICIFQIFNHMTRK